MHSCAVQTHCWDDGTPLEETLQALNTLVQAGKVHYIGVSNVTGWQFQKIIDKSREMGLTQIVSNQVCMCIVSACSEMHWVHKLMCALF